MAELFAIALIIGLFKPSWVLLGRIRDRSRVAFVYGLLVLGAIVGVGNTMPPMPEEEAEPNEAAAGDGAEADASVAKARADVDKLRRALRRLSDTTVEISEQDGRFHVTAAYEPKAVWSEASYVTSVAIHFFDLGSAAAKSGVPVSGVTTLAFAPSVDRYGNSDVSLALTLEIAAQDYGRINWDGIDFLRLLELAQVGTTPFGRSAVIEYCADVDNLKRTPNFCKRAFGG
jgi:hypothetical protein